MRVGVMVAGIRGATASTTAATAMRARPEDARFLISEAPFATPLDLVDVASIKWGGWDVIEEPWIDTVARHGVLDPEMAMPLMGVAEFEAVALPRDHAVEAGETEAEDSRGAELLSRLRSDIREFKQVMAVDRVVLVYLATPAMLPERSDWPQTADQLLSMLRDGEFATAAPYYVAAAIEEGCAVIDYTASATLEMPGLIELALERRVPLAGRDGSTGQTLLKSVLADTFSTRRLGVRGWYSTNILGNHDGLVLQDERFADTKRIDKTALLGEIVGYEVESHLVDIRYYRPAGDDKEAWDAIDFEGWFGCRGSLRVNWRCSDSLLAAPAIIDLVRFMTHALETGAVGIQAHLGVFFKYALGTRERRYLQLSRALVEFCEGEVAASAA